MLILPDQILGRTNLGALAIDGSGSGSGYPYAGGAIYASDTAHKGIAPKVFFGYQEPGFGIDEDAHDEWGMYPMLQLLGNNESDGKVRVCLDFVMYSRRNLCRRCTCAAQ